MYTPAITITWQEFTQVPTCDHTLEYYLTVESADGATRQALPSFITHDLTTKTFSIQTDDIADIGTWNLSVIGCSETGKQKV